jgi:hypothetical protein
MEEVYRKVGKRYRPVGWEFEGFPCDGIWLVQNGRKSRTCLISLDEKVPVMALNYRVHVNELYKRLMHKCENRNSWFDIATAACDYFAEQVEPVTDCDHHKPKGE